MESFLKQSKSSRGAPLRGDASRIGRAGRARRRARGLSPPVAAESVGPRARGPLASGRRGRASTGSSAVASRESAAEVSPRRRRARAAEVEDLLERPRVFIRVVAVGGRALLGVVLLDVAPARAGRSVWRVGQPRGVLDNKRLWPGRATRRRRAPVVPSPKPRRRDRTPARVATRAAAARLDGAPLRVRRGAAPLRQVLVGDADHGDRASSIAVEALVRSGRRRRPAMIGCARRRAVHETAAAAKL